MKYFFTFLVFFSNAFATAKVECTKPGANGGMVDSDFALITAVNLVKKIQQRWESSQAAQWELDIAKLFLIEAQYCRKKITKEQYCKDALQLAKNIFAYRSNNIVDNPNYVEEIIKATKDIAEIESICPKVK